MDSNVSFGLVALVCISALLFAAGVVAVGFRKTYKEERAYAKKVSARLQNVSAAPTVNVGGHNMAKKKAVKTPKKAKTPKKKMPVKKGN